MFTPLFSLQVQIQGKVMSEGEAETQMASIKASLGCWERSPMKETKKCPRSQASFYGPEALTALSATCHSKEARLRSRQDAPKLQMYTSRIFV